MLLRRICVTFLLLVLAGVPALAQDANLTTVCVAEYEEGVDYFPNKITVTEAENFSVEYFEHYKVVTVQNGAETLTYVLVQCGTPAPELADFPDNTQTIEVPAGDFAALSTTQLPHLAELGLIDELVALDSFLYTNTDAVREAIAADRVIEVAPNFELNMELLLSVEPDIVMTDGFDPNRLENLINAGIFTVVNTDYLEQSPLGRAEWVKFTALFYNEEAAATELYDDIASAYNDATQLVSDVPEDERPTVLYNTFSTFDDAWIVPGAGTYAGQLLTDAGGIIALGDEAPEESAFLSFEVVYDQALDADVWILNAFGVGTLSDFLAFDERYADFAAIEAGNVWNLDRDVNENGGNNFYERGVLRPDLVLLDLIAIFHPDLLPDHEFTFFRQLAG